MNLFKYCVLPHDVIWQNTDFLISKAKRQFSTQDKLRLQHTVNYTEGIVPRLRQIQSSADLQADLNEVAQAVLSQQSLQQLWLSAIEYLFYWWVLLHISSSMEAITILKLLPFKASLFTRNMLTISSNTL